MFFPRPAGGLQGVRVDQTGRNTKAATPEEEVGEAHRQIGAVCRKVAEGQRGLLTKIGPS